MGGDDTTQDTTDTTEDTGDTTEDTGGSEDTTEDTGGSEDTTEDTGGSEDTTEDTGGSEDTTGTDDTGGSEDTTGTDDTGTGDTTGTDDGGTDDGTGTGAPVGEYELIDYTQYEHVPHEDDPWWLPIKGYTDCETIDKPFEQGFEAESGLPKWDGTWFSITTISCDFGTVRFPLLEPIAAGTTVKATVQHGNLSFKSEGDYTIAFAFGANFEVAHTFTQPVPADESFIVKTFTVDHDYAAGDYFIWHVHNHGPNEWNLAELVANPESE